MTAHVCVTCGVQHGPSAAPPARCGICDDERQYVGHDGQRWTTLDELRAAHRADVRDVEPGLLGIGADPGVAIGQRALLVRGSAGNVLWDCAPLLDGAAEAVERAGGLAAIALSHPHFQSTAVEWAHAFDAPVLVHEDDRAWIMRPDPAHEQWSGKRHAIGDVSLVRCGGHFAGSAVLHWPGGSEGRGALFTADTIYVVPDRRYVSFMRSFPNLIPLGPRAVRGIVDAVRPLAFDRLYGGWWHSVLPTGAKAAVDASAERYLLAIAADG